MLVVDMRGALALAAGRSRPPARPSASAGCRPMRSPWPWRTGWPGCRRLRAADAAVAGQRRGDEPRLALVVLPHRRVHRAERRVGVDLDLVVLVALPLDPALALLDLRRQPGHVEMVQRLQPLLHVDAGAHRLGRADQDADAAGIEVVEQPLLVRRPLVVLHEGDLGRPARRRRTSSCLIQR